jgi:hypothetical protein
MCPQRSKILEAPERVSQACTQWWCLMGGALLVFVVPRYLCNVEEAGFFVGRMDRSISALAGRHCYRGQLNPQPSRVNLRKGIQNSFARLLAGHRFIGQEGRVWLFFERRVKGADRNDKTRCFLYHRQQGQRGHESASYHARAGKVIPAQPDAITILNLTPLILKCLVVHCEGKRMLTWNFLGYNHSIGTLFETRSA